MSAFVNVLTAAIGQREPFRREKARDRRSLCSWIVNRLRSRPEGVVRLRILEQLRATPRNGLVLIEVEGERLLMATSDGRRTRHLSAQRRSSGFRDPDRGKLRMSFLLIASRTAGHVASPLLPDLSTRFQPSDSTPWTILFVLTLVTLVPAILMCMTPLVGCWWCFIFCVRRWGRRRRPESDASGTWTDDDLVPDGARDCGCGSAGSRALQAAKINGWEAIELGSQPVKHFLLHYAREKDLALFAAAGQMSGLTLRMICRCG